MAHSWGEDTKALLWPGINPKGYRKMSMEKNWYIAAGGGQEGPFTQDEVSQKIAAGQLQGEHFVFKAGMQGWVKANTVPELASALGGGGGAPAPAPATPTTSSPTSSGLAPAPNNPNQDAHVIDFEIHGSEMQLVEITLDPGEACVAEAGAMTYMDPAIKMETIFGDGSKKSESGGLMGALLGAGKRLITGESLFMTLFGNQGSARQKVAFAAPYPGKVIAVDLKQVGGTLICQKDGFLCAAKGVSMGIAFQKKLGAGFFGGEGFILQKLEGDGYTFVHAGGTIIERDLSPGEMLKVDTGCLVAFQSSVNYDIQFVGGIKTAFLGGEGLFFATLTGPGKVWLQSLPFSRLADRILAHAPSQGGTRRGEGSALGSIGGAIMGGD